MDLNTITAVLRPRARADLAPWRPGDAFLAGGTWLFSEPQVHLSRLIDLGELGWEPARLSEAGLTIAATCTLAELERLELPPACRAAPLLGQCCRALLGSFKVRAVATVGGNLCLALPAGPMVALLVALDATCLVWGPDGAERTLEARDVVIGPKENALRPGEVLRSVAIPAEALRRRTAFRRISLTPEGRSGALAIGTLDAAGAFTLTITAATCRPVQLRWSGLPGPEGFAAAVSAGIDPALWYNDVHGAPDWRAHVTPLLASEVRDELAGTVQP